MSWKNQRRGQLCFFKRLRSISCRSAIAAEGALRDVISRTPIQAAMSDKRQQIADETHASLQKLLDDEHAGVRDRPGAVTARRAAARRHRRLQRRATRPR